MGEKDKNEYNSPEKRTSVGKRIRTRKKQYKYPSERIVAMRLSKLETQMKEVLDRVKNIENLLEIFFNPTSRE